MRRFGLILTAVCALSALATSSANAGPRFLFIPFGILGVKALTKQTLTTSAGSISCEAVSLLNTSATAEVEESQHATIDYEKCVAFGLSATVSPALYLIHANGEVDLLNSPVVKTVGCEVKILAKSGLKSVLFRNLHGALSITWHLSNVLSQGTGAACTYAEEGNGVLAGAIDIRLIAIGAIILWHPA